MDINLNEAPDQEEGTGLGAIVPGAPQPGAEPALDISQAPDQVTEAEDAFKAASAENPDRAAQVLQISGKLGTDPQHVDKNFDEAKRAAASPGQDYWLSLKDRNPAVYDWYSNRSNMALAHDDIGVLEELSQTIQSGIAGWELGNAQGRMGDEGRRAMDEVGQIGMLSEPTKQRLADVQKRVNDASKRAEKYKDGWIFSAAQVLPFMTRPFISGGAGGETEIGKGLIGMGAGAATGAAIGAVGGPVGALAGAGIGAATGNWRASADTEGGLAFVDYVQDGIDPVRAKEVATVVGEINGALEGTSDIVLGKLFGKVAGRLGAKMIPADVVAKIAKVPGGSKIAEVIEANSSVFAGLTLTQAIARAGKIMAKSVAVETGTEVLQEIPPQVGQAVLEGKTIDPDMAGKILSNAVQVVPQTLKAMTVLGGLGGGVHLALDIKDMRKSEATKQVIEALGDAAKKSKLLQRAPEKLAEFVNTVTKDGPVKEVYISPQAIETFFQAAGIDPEKGAAELGIAEALKEQQETGDKLAIPLGIFAEKIGANPDLVKLISDDVSFRSDVPSVNEVKQSKAEMDEFAAQLDQAIAEMQSSQEAMSADKIYETVAGQLKKAGGKKKQALVASEFYRVMGGRAGLTPEQLWDGVMKLSVLGVDEIRMSPDPDQGGALYQSEVSPASPLGFYSQVRREVEKMDFKSMPAKDLLGRINNLKGIKSDELEFLGIREWLTLQPEGAKVSKADVVAFIESNGVKLEQVVLSEEFGRKEREARQAARDRDASNRRRSDTTPHVDDLSFEDGSVEPDESEYEYETDYYLNESDFFDEVINEWRDGDFRDELRDELESEYTDKDGNVDEEALTAALDAEIKRLDDRGEIKEKAIEALGLEREAREYAIESVNENNDRQYVEESETGFRLEWSRNRGSYEIYKDGRYIEDIPYERGRLIRDSVQAQSALFEWIVDEGHATSQRDIPSNEVRFGPLEDVARDVRQSEIRHDNLAGRSVLEQGPNDNQWELVAEDIDANIEVHKEFEADSFEEAQAKSLEFMIEKGLVREVEEETKTEQPALPAPEPVDPTLPHNKPAGMSKHGTHTQDGGTNYREFLLQTKPKGDEEYSHMHFSQPNYIAHIRVKDRIDGDGKKTLYIEEIQFDWLADVRRLGVKSKELSDEIAKAKQELEAIRSADYGGKDAPQDVLDRAAQLGDRIDALERQDRNAVPAPPISSKEVAMSLAMKRMLRLAVEEGYDSVSWTPAQVHVDKWGTDVVAWKKIEGGFTVDSTEIEGGEFQGRPLDVVARERGILKERRGAIVRTKEELQKVIEDTSRGDEERADKLAEVLWERMQGEPEGMNATRKQAREFEYDNMLPRKVMPAILKKLDKDAKVSVGTVTDTKKSGDAKMWQVRITDAMREKIGEGFSLFQRDGDLAKGSITFNPKEAVIRLAKIKDESTAYHEFGHHFLRVLEALAVEPGAAPSIMEDYRIVRDWMNLDPREAMKREHEEKFADAFLVYLYEGKTPNKKLQGVFDRFRRWVITTLRWLTSKDYADRLGTNLSPELRGVFDRMLATEEEIQRARLESGFVGIENQVAELSLEQLSRLQELQRDAHARALATILSGQIRDLEADGLEKYTQNEAEQRRQAKAQLEALPVFKANKAIVKALKSKQGAVQVMRDYLLGKKAKHWPTFETIAEAHGYPSADKMAEDIITAKELDEAIEDEVKNRMSFDYHRKLIDREAIRQKAQEILHNDRSLDILALEQEYLSDLLRGVDEAKSKAKDRTALRSGQLQYARQRAKEIVGRMSTDRVRKLGPFYTIERRSAQAVGKALGQKKYAEAAKLKGQQMLNHAVASEAAKAKARVAKGLAQLEKIRRKPMESFKTEEHFHQVGALLARLGMQHTGYNPEARTETLAEWAARMEGMTNAVAIADWIMDESKSLDPRRLTVDQFADALDAVKNVIQVANLENRALTIMGKVDLGEIIAKLQDSRDENLKGRTPYQPKVEPDAFDKATELAAGYALSQIRIQNLAKSIQGFSDNGPWTEVFERSIDQAATVESQLKREYISKLEALYKPYSDAERYALGTRKIFIPEFGSAVTKSTLIALARNLGNAGNKTKLLSTPIVGMQDPAAWTEENLMGVLERELETRDWQLVQGSWDLINSLWPKIVELHKDVTGFSPGKVEATPLVVRTKDGETLSLEGGYYPLARDPRASRAQEILSSLDTPLFKEGNSSWRAATRTGHTKARVSAEYAVSLDEGILYQHITDVIHDIAFRKLVIDLGRIMNRPEVRAMVQERHGVPGLRMFDEFVRSIAFEEKPESSSTRLDAVMNTLRRNASITYMALSIKNWVQNGSNVFIYGGAVDGFSHTDSLKTLSTIGLKHAKNAITDRAEYQKMREFVFTLSPFMKDKNERPDLSYSWLSKIGLKKRGVKRVLISRFAGEDSALTTGADKVAVGLEDVIEFGRGVMAATDEITSIPIWIGAYNKALDEGKSQEEAVEFADNLIRTALGSGRRYDASTFLRSPNSLVRLVAMFMTFVNTQANRLYLETGRAAMAGDVDKNVVLRVMGNRRYQGYLAANLFAFPLLSALMAFKGPDEDDDKAKWAAKEIATYPFSMLPGVRDVVPPMIGLVLGTEGFSPRRGSAATAGIDAGFDTFKALLSDDKSFADVMESITKTGAFLIPYPDQINTLLWNTYDVTRGAMKPEVSDVVRRRPRSER